jgi:hypothetical protein
MNSLKLDDMFNTYDPITGELYARQNNRGNKSSLGQISFEGLPEKDVYPAGLDAFPLKTNDMPRKDASSKFTRDGIPLHPSESISIPYQYVQEKFDHLAFEGDAQKEKNHPEDFVLLSNTYIKRQLDTYPDGLLRNRPDHPDARRKVALERYKDLKFKASQIPDKNMRDLVIRDAEMNLMEEDPELYSSYALENIKKEQALNSKALIDAYDEQKEMTEDYMLEMEKFVNSFVNEFAKDRKNMQALLTSMAGTTGGPSAGGSSPPSGAHSSPKSVTGASISSATPALTLIKGSEPKFSFLDGDGDFIELKSVDDLPDVDPSGFISKYAGDKDEYENFLNGLTSFDIKTDSSTTTKQRRFIALSEFLRLYVDYNGELPDADTVKKASKIWSGGMSTKITSNTIKEKVKERYSDKYEIYRYFTGADLLTLLEAEGVDAKKHAKSKKKILEDMLIDTLKKAK